MADAKELNELNRKFYQKVAPFFSQTRQGWWVGWEKLPLPQNGDWVLDVAAGNCRFANFLASKKWQGEYVAVDNCQELLDLSVTDKKQQVVIDLLNALQTQEDWQKKLPRAEFNYVICNAFFHHIPKKNWREKMLRDLWRLTAKNGFLIVSLWQFMNDAKMTNKVVEDLGDNDYILPWKNGTEAKRYCHNFTMTEIAELQAILAAEKAKLVVNGTADGATGQMNYYLGWQKLS